MKNRFQRSLEIQLIQHFFCFFHVISALSLKSYFCQRNCIKSSSKSVKKDQNLDLNTTYWCLIRNLRYWTIQSKMAVNRNQMTGFLTTHTILGILKAVGVQWEHWFLDLAASRIGLEKIEVHNRRLILFLMFSTTRNLNPYFAMRTLPIFSSRYKTKKSFFGQGWKFWQIWPF